MTRKPQSPVRILIYRTWAIIAARCEVRWTLRACYKHTDLLYFRSSFHFILMRFRYVCVFVLIHFQERFQIDAFSMKMLSVLVWTEGLNAYKYVRFQTKPLRVRLVWTGPYSFFHAHWQVLIAAQGFQAMITGCVLVNVNPLVFTYNHFGSRHKSSEIWTRSLPLGRHLIYATLTCWPVIFRTKN